MISLFLQQQGTRVVTAANGEDAIKVATQTVPNLILMDISMPTLDDSVRRGVFVKMHDFGHTIIAVYWRSEPKAFSVPLMTYGFPGINETD
jgi:CheY-like chemotaxis protein